MIFYITYNDAPSGIYSSQVIDVVKFFNDQLKTRAKLISFISIRGFLVNRKKIKQQLPSAIVLPMYPKVINWKKNKFLLQLLNFVYNPKIIIGRSVLATNIALSLQHKNKKIIYDGRGAIKAEWTEYNVISDKSLLSQIDELEKNAVIKSDFRISVSNKLVDYWKKEFHYTQENHVIITCTINNQFEKTDFNENTISQIRLEFDFQKKDTVFVYSGSVAGWQSFELLSDFITPILLKSTENKLLFLSHSDENISKLKSQFPKQVYNKHLPVNEVPKYLVACNYGLLIREQSVTNQVASPVKFAEYLACDLPVIISENLGDYSDFIIEHNCGQLYQNFDSEKKSNKNLKQLCNTYFAKNIYTNSYTKLTQL